MTGLRELIIDGRTINFTPLPLNKFISLSSLQSEISEVAESIDWAQHVEIEPKIELAGTVVKGFGRGSKQLGVPTANVEMTEINKEKTAGLVPGVYASKAVL